MRAKELLDAGELTPAIELLGAELRSQPGDVFRRTFLFELLCYAGELTRAERQLDAIGHRGAEPATRAGVAFYRGLLEAERQRARLFEGGEGRPRFLLEPPPSVEVHLEALGHLLAARPAEARAALERAAALRAPVRGTTAAGPCDDLRDADDLLAPVLEVYAPIGYCWVPWEQVQSLEIPPPQSLRDLLWAPARFAGPDGQGGEVFLPTLYPGSCAHADDQVKLGRKTVWLDAGAGIVRGVGRKLLLVGDEASTLLELGWARLARDGGAGAVAGADVPPGGGP
jgi:type VI secretion system protein ImpE